MASTLVKGPPHTEASPSPVSIHSDSESLAESSRSPQHETHRTNRHHPYSRHSHPSPPKLHFTMKSLGRNNQPDIGLTDVIKGRDILLKGLSSLSNETLALIAMAKHASLKTVRQNILQLGWEIEEAECHKLVLKAIEQEGKKRLEMAESEYSLFKKLVADRDLPTLSQDVEYL
ncbi:hypothetical protein BDR03DRAFT_1003910 [Suillus americanus]|nr:hypothetical protein BDR03DRAFT_1003910 [Suillus americanus]